jgi:hypothetical protein
VTGTAPKAMSFSNTYIATFPAPLTTHLHYKHIFSAWTGT